MKENQSDVVPYYDTNRRDYEAYMAEAAQRLQFQHDFSQSALKTLVLVNGGAIIALFTFLGHERAAFDLLWLKRSFASFAGGLGLAMFAYFGAFYSQASYMLAVHKQAINSRSAMARLDHREDESSEEKRGDTFLKVGVGAALLSLGSFAGGAIAALIGLA
ncbi:hypothetical protein GGR90_002010 [Sphingopyxis italica]|uniref:Uncharacterized protein n=1 Tax=Sphingopyxis italica TaxID=1129133 RepID=A0A7X5XRB4_9SPHN|nr:hypothetical protein [Sphingopyxis italica]NJB89835.1 hypothetical protein [Sphingopyxis italica]